MSDFINNPQTGRPDSLGPLATTTNDGRMSKEDKANIVQDLRSTASPTFVGLTITAGANAKMGIGTLSAGTVTINNTNVTANSYIFMTGTGGGVLANIGAIYEDKPSRTAGTSFIVKSLNVLDSSTFVYLIIEPA